MRRDGQCGGAREAPPIDMSADHFCDDPPQFLAWKRGDDLLRLLVVSFAETQRKASARMIRARYILNVHVFLGRADWGPR